MTATPVVRAKRSTAENARGTQKMAGDVSRVNLRMNLMKDKVHTLEEFNTVPWDKMDPAELSKSWTYGYGGHGFRDHQMWIMIFTNDPDYLDGEIWPVPPAFQAMMSLEGKMCADQVKSELRNLLGAQTSGD